jgi:hypothetical protein
MREFASITLTLVLTMLFANQSLAQGTLASLYLSISGSGEIYPFQDGQMLEVGQSYQMTAVPDSGFAFSSWQPVHVFTLTSTVIGGTTAAPITNVTTSIIPNLAPVYFTAAVLPFTMQPVQVLYNTNGNALTEGSGWPANFEPIPEPSAYRLIASGVAAIVLLRSRGSHCGQLPLLRKTNCPSL